MCNGSQINRYSRKPVPTVISNYVHLVSTFEQVDSDADGKISYSEFDKSQRSMTPQPPESTIKAIFNATDVNGDRQLDPDEYHTLSSNLRADSLTQAEEIFKV